MEQSRVSAIEKMKASVQSAGIESVITAAIAIALWPYQDEMQRLQSSILIVQQAQSEFASMVFEVQDGEAGEDSDLGVSKCSRSSTAGCTYRRARGEETKHHRRPQTRDQQVNFMRWLEQVRIMGTLEPLPPGAEHWERMHGR